MTATFAFAHPNIAFIEYGQSTANRGNRQANIELATNRTAESANWSPAFISSPPAVMKAVSNDLK
jgi:hypothetical protein